MGRPILGPFLAAAFLFSGVALIPGQEILGVTEPWGAFMSPELPGQGFLPVLAGGILAGGGYRLSMGFYPWARALATAKTGQAGLLFGAYRTDEREAFFLFSDPFCFGVDALFTLKGRSVDFDLLSDLEPYTIGVVRGAAHGQAFDQATKLRKEEAASTSLNVEKLLAGRVDLIAGPREVVWGVIRDNFPDKASIIVQVPRPLSRNPVHIAVPRSRPDAPALVALLNRGLRDALADGSYYALAKRYGIAEESLLGTGKR